MARHIKDIEELLKHPIPADETEQIPKGGKFFDYAKGSYIYKMMSVIFGLNWSSRIISHEWEKDGSLTVLLGVDVTYIDENGQLTTIHREDYGGALPITNRKMLDMKKVAATDAMKRVVRTIGFALGLSLYFDDDEFLEGDDVPVEPKQKTEKPKTQSNANFTGNTAPQNSNNNNESEDDDRPLTGGSPGFYSNQFKYAFGKEPQNLNVTRGQLNKLKHLLDRKKAKEDVTAELAAFRAMVEPNQAPVAQQQTQQQAQPAAETNDDSGPINDNQKKVLYGALAKFDGYSLEFEGPLNRVETMTAGAAKTAIRMLNILGEATPDRQKAIDRLKS